MSKGNKGRAGLQVKPLQAFIAGRLAIFSSIWQPGWPVRKAARQPRKTSVG